LAASIVSDHSIQAFTKVWLLKNQVTAFNGHIGATIPLKGLPVIGGVDGKDLLKLLSNVIVEELKLGLSDANQLEILTERKSKLALSVMDASAYIDVTAKHGEGIFTVPCDALEDINLKAMLNLRELQNDPMPDLTALNICPSTDKLILYTCDRGAINRSYWSIDSDEHANIVAPIHISLDFMKMLTKLWGTFSQGDLTITNSHAVAEFDGIKLYAKLVAVQSPLDFRAVTDRVWNGVEYDKKLLVEIPDGFRETFDNAAVLTTDKVRAVNIDVADNELTLSMASTKGKIEETMPLASDHPNVRTCMSVDLVRRVMNDTERMHIGQGMMVMFGPLRFASYIGSKT